MNSQQRANPTDTQAVLACGDWVFGVGAERVVQVVPRPASLTTLPRSGHCLAGVLPFRGQAVPVVDLQAWHQPGRTPAPAQPLIAVLSDGANRVGLLVDEARSLRRIPQERIQRLHHDEDANELFHSVASLEDGSLLSLLDPVRLMQRARVWSEVAAPAGLQVDADPAETGEQVSGAGGRTGSYALLRLGHGLYGLPTASVAELIRRPALQSVWGHTGRLMGMLRWRERDVPVVNPAPELGEPVTSDAPWLALLCDASSGPEGPVIAVPCNGLERVATFDARSVQAMDSAVATGGTACTGLIQEDGGPLRLLDADALVAALALRFETPEGAPSRSLGGRGAVLHPQALVVFQARASLAVPIQQLQSIEPLPATDLVARAARGQSPHETMNWRGKALPLVCLQQHLRPGEPAVTPYRRVLITTIAGRLCAWLIGEVEQLIAPKTGQLTRVRLPEGRMVDIVTHDQPNGRASHELLDFAQLSAPV
jgi:chemotaxis signal transduction protein